MMKLFIREYLIFIINHLDKNNQNNTINLLFFLKNDLILNILLKNER